MSDDDFDIKETEETKRMDAWFQAVAQVADNIEKINEKCGLGTEYFSSLLQYLGLPGDAEKLREASWAAMCEWDL